MDIGDTSYEISIDGELVNFVRSQDNSSGAENNATYTSVGGNENQTPVRPFDPQTRERLV